MDDDVATLPDVKLPRFVVVTGMSGAGRSTALRAVEDRGFFCVDNIPPPLIPGLVTLVEGTELQRIGLGVDVRTGTFLEGAHRFLAGLVDAGHTVSVVFLECQDEELVRRFSETRRGHPLAPEGDLLDAIHRERERLSALRTRADLTIDTTHLSVHDLRRQLRDYLAPGPGESRMSTRILSFGFKNGLPVDADLVFDLRHLPNPHFVPALRPKTGCDAEVAEFVFAAPEARELRDDLAALLRKLLPRYEREGKAYLTVAIGCTGGQHRSVAMAEALGPLLTDIGRVGVSHRDKPRVEGA